MAVGIAISKKLMVKGAPLTIDTRIFPIIKYLVNVQSDKNLEKIKKWTIGNLLTHTTGYEKQMFSERFVKDLDENSLLDYALNYAMPYEVGERYAYNNVEPFVISVLFQEAFDLNLSDFINEHIFKKMGIIDYKWLNYGKYCVAATGLYLRHTDFHKIAQLFLNGGNYNNEVIVPKAWIDSMCTPFIKSIAEFKPQRVFPKIWGGYFTFVSRDGFVFRDGSNGQYLILNKDMRILITILSTEPEMKNVTEVLRGLL